MKFFIVIVNLIRLTKCSVEPLVVGGQSASVMQFPYVGFLVISCDSKSVWTCGSSIVNQKIMLTAAHCVQPCVQGGLVTVSVGHRITNKGSMSSVHSIFYHKDFSITTLLNDIALLKLKTSLQFNNNVKRLVFMAKPPYYEKALVAGWGYIQEVPAFKVTDELQFVDQYVLEPPVCIQQIGRKLAPSELCAESKNITSYTSGGDSGSALVVRGYIQIGIVSYKMPGISRSLVVYTDTGYYYRWIVQNAKKLYCVNQE